MGYNRISGGIKEKPHLPTMMISVPMSFETSFFPGGGTQKNTDLPDRRVEVEDRYEGIDTRVASEAIHVFDEHADPKDRIGAIVRGVGDFMSHFDETVLSSAAIDAVLADVRACEDIRDRDGFVEAVVRAVRPVMELRKTHPGLFEDAEAVRMNEGSDFIPLNRLVSYGKTGEIIHIHHVPGKTVSGKRTLYLDAMEKLAVIVSQDPEVKLITATSWIVAEHPKMFELSGFDIGDVSKEVRENHFAKEKRDIKTATIGRDELLRRFLGAEEPVEGGDAEKDSI